MARRIPERASIPRSMARENIPVASLVVGAVLTALPALAAAEEKAPPPSAAQPTAAQPTAAQPTAAQPTAAQPTAAQPTAAQPVTAREQAKLEATRKRQAEAERVGDAGLARRLAALSARWTKVLDALGTAARLEAEAARLEDERIAVQEATGRLITLVEQTEARRARALARLQALGLEPPPAEGGTR